MNTNGLHHPVGDCPLDMSGSDVSKEFFMLNPYEREICPGHEFKMPTIEDILKSLTMFAVLSKENASLDYILIFLAEEERALVMYLLSCGSWC